MIIFPPAYGSSTKVSDPFSSALIVNSPEQMAGELDSTKIYIIDGLIDFTGTGISIEIPVNGLNLTGWTFDISKLVCSDDNYTLFSSPIGGSGGILGSDFAIEVTGGLSKVYDLSDASGNNAFELSKINYNNCSSLGVMNGYRQGLELDTGRFGGTPELTLSGSWSGGYICNTTIVRGVSSGSYSLFKSGAGFLMASRFKTDINADLPVGVSLMDFSPSNFPNPSTLQIQNTIISRDGVFDPTNTTTAPNITEKDLSSSWVNNIGIQNTHVGGELTISSEVATNILVQGEFYDLSGSYVAEDLQHFDNPFGSQLRNLGDNPRDYNVIFNLTVDGVRDREVVVKIVRWDSSESVFIDVATQRRTINNLAGGRDVAFFNDFVTGTLDKNDYFKIQITDNSGTGNLTAELDGFIRVGAR